MTVLWRFPIVATLALAGCATEPPPPVPVQPVKVVGSSFCKTMQGLFPPDGKPSWDVADTPRSIEDDLKLERAVDKSCSTPNPKTTR